jgi:hypothetical protein
MRVWRRALNPPRLAYPGPLRARPGAFSGPVLGRPMGFGNPIPPRSMSQQGVRDFITPIGGHIEASTRAEHARRMAADSRLGKRLVTAMNFKADSRSCPRDGLPTRRVMRQLRAVGCAPGRTAAGPAARVRGTGCRPDAAGAAGGRSLRPQQASLPQAAELGQITDRLLADSAADVALLPTVASDCRARGQPGSRHVRCPGGRAFVSGRRCWMDRTSAGPGPRPRR